MVRKTHNRIFPELDFDEEPIATNKYQSKRSGSVINRIPNNNVHTSRAVYSNNAYGNFDPSEYHRPEACVPEKRYGILPNVFKEDQRANYWVKDLYEVPKSYKQKMNNDQSNQNYVLENPNGPKHEQYHGDQFEIMPMNEMYNEAQVVGAGNDYNYNEYNGEQTVDADEYDQGNKEADMDVASPFQTPEEYSKAELKKLKKSKKYNFDPYHTQITKPKPLPNLPTTKYGLPFMTNRAANHMKELMQKKSNVSNEVRKSEAPVKVITMEQMQAMDAWYQSRNE